jgi:transposase
VKHTGLARTSVKRILKKSEIKLKNEYITTPGRPKKIGEKVRNSLRSRVKKDDRKTLGYFQNSLEEKVSKPTLSRVFREIGLSRRKMMTKPLLTATHQEKRVDFALAHANPKFDWTKWIFSDEKKFNLDGPDGYKYYWHFEGSEPKIFSRDSNSRASVMVWGGISKNGVTALVEVPKKCDSKKYCTLLQEGLIPYYDDGDTFQQDGAKCHTSKETMKFLKENKIETVSWPAKSPDLNIIENVWGWMVKDIYFGKPAYKNIEELKKAVFDSWARIPDDLLDKLVDSMPRRMRKVIEMKGKTIDY